MVCGGSWVDLLGMLVNTQGRRRNQNSYPWRLEMVGKDGRKGMAYKRVFMLPRKVEVWRLGSSLWLRSLLSPGLRLPHAQVVTSSARCTTAQRQPFHFQRKGFVDKTKVEDG
jgi:hypothetical protein